LDFFFIGFWWLDFGNLNSSLGFVWIGIGKLRMWKGENVKMCEESLLRYVSDVMVIKVF